MIFNFIIIILVFFFSYHLYKKKTLYFICFLPFLIQYLWMFLSILVIERGVYINEQGRNGEFVFSGFFLLLFFIVSIISFVFFFQLFNKIFKLNIPKLRFLKANEIKITLVILIIILFLAYLNLLSSPSIFNSPEISKFNYWNFAKYPFFKIFLGNTAGYIPFIFGLTFKNYKKSTIVLILLYIVYLIGIDQKFTAFLFGGMSFILSYSIVNKEFNEKYNILSFKKRYLIIVSALMFSLVLFKYSKVQQYKYLGLSPVEAVFHRAFGLQAHLFWGVSEKYLYNGESKTWDLMELPYGMHVLMEDFIPKTHKKSLKGLWERGVSWTNAYPAILIRVFPLPIALIFHFFIFSVVPFVYALLVKAVNDKNYLLSIIFFQIILWLTNIYTMAYFYKLNKILFIIILISFLSYFVNKSKFKDETIS